MPDANTPAGNIPPQTVPDAASAAPSSLQSPPSDLSERAARATSPSEIRAIIAEGRKIVPLKPETPPAVEPQADPKAATPDVPEGQAPETPTSETAETPEAATPESKPEGSEDENDDGSLKIPSAKQLRINLAEADQVGRLTAAIMRRNRDMTMEDALQVAKKQLGIKPAVEEAATAKAEAPKSDLPETIEAVDTTLQTLDADREKAFTELRFEDVAKIDRKIRTLDRHRYTLEQQAARQQAETATSWNRKFDASEAQAQDLYEFVAKPDSPGAKRMIEIEADLKELNDPLYYSADKPLKIAQMVAAELSIPPRRKGAPAAPAKAAVTPPPAPPRPKQVLPTGANRTAAPIDPTTAIQAEVAKITNPHQLRQFLKPLVGRR